MSDLEHARPARHTAERQQTQPPPMRNFYMPAMPPLGLITAVENLIRAWYRRRRFRQRYVPLLAYDDSILEDVGLHRQDIDWALGLPLHEDAQ